ncbi:MAG: hypothetical protein LBC70_11165 [Chitinispirillales bacterium]|jgi:hypothetical protein|nr:hypothetical protein [Chitinispirillales bacterium]
MNIRHTLFCGLLIAAALFQAADAARSFEITVADGSEFTVWRAASEERERLSENSTVAIGDTLFAPANQDVTIQLESNTKVLVKGGSVLALGEGPGVDIALTDGQVFLDRNQPHELREVSISTSGYLFTPEGTAAAVKTTPQGAPTVAVLRGNMRMTSAQGESVTIGARQFGTVNNAGGLVSGELNERGLQQLESWSGVKAEERSEPAAAAAPAAAVAVTAAATVAVTQPSTPPSSLPQDAAPVETSEIEPLEQAEYAGLEPNESEQAGRHEDTNQSHAEKPAAAHTPLFARPDFELSVGATTVDGETWTRFALGIDMPIWRFGVFFDIELFIDSENKVSNKGWDFKDNAAEAIFRKIRYIRYGHEPDPLFIKFGGLSNVTLGYGIIVNNFTNMLNYPDEKLLGLQFYLNDISDMGVSLQTLISDFAEMSDDGGVYAARLAFRPLKPTGMFLLDRFTVGATYALDRNTHAPARRWTVDGDDAILRDMRDMYGETEFFDAYREIYEWHKEVNADQVLDRLDDEDAIRGTTRGFSVYGFDAGLPIINTPLLGVDIYGQTAIRADSVRGWGIGAPGVAVRVWRLSGNLEYRKVEGRFTHGFFDRYYLDERFSRGLLMDKSEYLPDVSLNGVFGSAGMDVFSLFRVGGSYQYMLGKDDARDQRYEASAGIGDAVMSRIPKINLAEIYIRNSHIGLPANFKFEKDGSMTDEKAWLFDRTPFMYWGYRAGFEITAGASLIFDYRYGWNIDNGRLVADNYMLLQTAFRF